MIEGKTKSGFSFSVRGSMLNDFRLIEALADVKSGDGGRSVDGMTALVNLMFDPEQKRMLYAYASLDDGSVPIDKVMEIVNEVFEAVGEISSGAKKS